jgi:hypothetical protein
MAAAAADHTAAAALSWSSIPETEYGGHFTGDTARSTHDAIAAVTGLRPDDAENVPPAATATATTGGSTTFDITANTPTTRVPTAKSLPFVTITDAKEPFISGTGRAAADAVSNTATVAASISVAAAAANEAAYAGTEAGAFTPSPNTITNAAANSAPTPAAYVPSPSSSSSSSSATCFGTSANGIRAPADI